MAEILLGNIKGPKGVTFTPNVDSSGNLSWSNDGGLTNPATVNIKGPKGDQGPAGEGGGGSGDAIPKTGNRGVLAGFNTINSLTDPTETVVIDGLASDDTFVGVTSGNTNISFAEGSANETWVKHVCVMSMGGTVSFNLPDSGMVLFDNLGATYEVGVIDTFVYVWYGNLGIVYTRNIL